MVLRYDEEKWDCRLYGSIYKGHGRFSYPSDTRNDDISGDNNRPQDWQSKIAFLQVKKEEEKEQKRRKCPARVAGGFEPTRTVKLPARLRHHHPG